MRERKGACVEGWSFIWRLEAEWLKRGCNQRQPRPSFCTPLHHLQDSSCNKFSSWTSGTGSTARCRSSSNGGEIVRFERDDGEPRTTPSGRLLWTRATFESNTHRKVLGASALYNGWIPLNPGLCPHLVVKIEHDRSHISVNANLTGAFLILKTLDLPRKMNKIIYFISMLHI